MTDTLSIAEAAQYLRLGLKATRALFDRGELPGVSLNAKHTCFLRSDLEDYVRRTAREQSAARQRAALATANAQHTKRCGRRRALPDLVPYEIAAQAARPRVDGAK